MIWECGGFRGRGHASAIRQKMRHRWHLSFRRGDHDVAHDKFALASRPGRARQRSIQMHQMRCRVCGEASCPANLQQMHGAQAGLRNTAIAGRGCKAAQALASDLRARSEGLSARPHRFAQRRRRRRYRRTRTRVRDRGCLGPPLATPAAVKAVAISATARSCQARTVSWCSPNIRASLR